MNSPLSFIAQIDAAYRSNDPEAALLEWLLRSSTSLSEEEYAHFVHLLHTVREEHECLPRDWNEHRSNLDTRSADTLSLRLEEGNHCLATSELQPGIPLLMGASLRPGAYRLVLSTGWVLWEARLTKQELRWSHAHPREALPLAAESEHAAVPAPALEQELLNGELTVRIYPGLESGRMEVTRRG